MKNIRAIVNKLKIRRGTVRKYLKQGCLLGWCDYNANDEKIKNIRNIANKFSKPIICLTTGEIFISINEASKKYNINESGISACFNGRQKSAGKNPVNGEKLIWEFYNEGEIK